MLKGNGLDLTGMEWTGKDYDDRELLAGEERLNPRSKIQVERSNRSNDSRRLMIDDDLIEADRGTGSRLVNKRGSIESDLT